jgi:fructose-1,6-bisphosphatase I/sedoheptulose-1,7-bisphosphatase/fructose-1,6-bisphosphatase I
MKLGRTNVNKFLVEEQSRNPALGGDFLMLISDVVRACKTVSGAISRGALTAYPSDGGAEGSPAELQTRLTELAHSAIVHHCEWGGHLAAMSSEQTDAVLPIPGEYPRGKYLLLFDALDGSPNVDVNMSVGSIFSILRCADDCAEPTAEDFLQPGVNQVAAGYALYGPSSMLVLTVGTGVHGFTFDRDIGEYILTQANLKVAEDAGEFAINASNERFWEPPVRRYVTECHAGKTGIRGKDFTMRWVASLVAEVHRILMRGGVFMYPRDTREINRPGRLRLMYEANPMALIIEQAGGLASTGRERILDVAPTGLEQRTPVFLGSLHEVERLAHYHREYDDGNDQPYTSPLFSTRTLFREQ